MPPRVVVLGAGGRTGAACVDALEAAGTPAVAVVRDPAKHSAALGGRSGVELAQGDVTDQESAQSLRRVLAGASGAVFAASGSGYLSAKDVDLQGVANVAEAVKEQGNQAHIVLVSSALVSPRNRWHPIRMMLNNFRWGLMDCKYKGEEALRRSGCAYTVIRPGGLTGDPPGQAVLVAAQGDNGSGRVARADVAAACVAALTDPAARNVTLELTSKPAAGTPPRALAQQLKGLFQGLRPDAPAA